MATPPAAPSLARRLVAALRAGAFAAGGSVAALALAVLVDRPWLSYRAPFFLWLTGTLAAAALSVRHGYPEPPRGAHAYLARALGVVVCGVGLGAAVVVAGLQLFPGPIGDAVGPHLAEAALLLVVARATLRRPRAELDLPAGPGGLLPASSVDAPAGAYGLAATGPALTAEESERADLAVEVRVLWGGEVLRVHHLDPPRRFHVGHVAADVAIDVESLGAARLAIVEVDGAGVRAVVPRGASAMVQGRPGEIERVDGEEATRVPLTLGDRVSITLPSRAAGTAYRDLHGGADPGASRLVIEVALVRAGRVVGRGLSLGDGAPLLACTVASSVAILGALGYSALCGCPVDRDEGPSDDQRFAIHLALQAVADRELEEEEEREREHPTPEPGVARESTGSWGGMIGLLRFDRDPEPDDLLAQRPFDSFAELDMFGTRSLCFSYEASETPLGASALFGDARSAFCGTQVVTPFGLRALGAPPGRDVLGRDPTDRWVLDRDRALRRPALFQPGAVAHFGHRARTVWRPYVEIEAMTREERWVPRFPVDHLLQQRARDLRDCYELGLRNDPNLVGQVEVRLSVGVDGAVRASSTGRPNMPDAVVSRCVGVAIDGARIARQAHARAWTYRVHLLLVEDRLTR